MRAVVEGNDGGIFSETFEKIIGMLEAYCGGENTIKKIMIDREKIMHSVETFREERGKIGGPIIERKVIPAPAIATPDGKEEQKASA